MMEEVGPVLNVRQNGRSAKYELWKSLGGRTGLPPWRKSRDDEEGRKTFQWLFYCSGELPREALHFLWLDIERLSGYEHQIWK